MKRSKLIPILKSFSKEEIKEFDKFLDSPFFGCKKFVLNFFRVISGYYPEFEEENIDKKKIFKKIYGGKSFNDALVRRIISDLIRFSEEYMTYKNFRNRKTFRESCLLNELRIRNLPDQFRIRSVKISDNLESSKMIDPEMLFEKYFVNLEIKEFRTAIRDSKMHASYSLSVEAFTVLFFRIIFSYTNHRSTFISEYKIQNEIPDLLFKNINLNALLKEIELKDNQYSIYLKMVFYVYNIVKDKNDRESYFKLMDLLNNYPENFTQPELKNIYISIIRFYNFQDEKYDNIFLKEKYKAYRLFITDFFSLDPNSKLQISFCRNYINLCRQMGETDEIRIFKDRFRDYLHPDYKEDLISFCEAVFLFEKKMFQRSLQYASAINLDREIFKLDVKILKIRNYYELRYYDSVYSELDNLLHFLNSSCKLNPRLLKKAKNFSKIVRHLTKLRSGSVVKKNVLTDLMMLLEKEKNISEKNWLTDKIRMLGN